MRVAFGGTQTTDKPLVASLAIECGALVSIMGADTRIVNGQTLGSMLLALPEDEHAEAALEYIKNYPGITYEGGEQLMAEFLQAKIGRLFADPAHHPV